jgi:hypothetical protein
MPWLSIPLEQKVAQNKINSLSSSFWVQSIPTLVVLTNEGLYVTKNAKMQVSNVIGSNRSISSPHMVLDSWKKMEHVPIDEAYLGVISSIYKSMKNGYNYIMGYETAKKTIEHDDENGDNHYDHDHGHHSHLSQQKKLISPKIVLSFFQKTITKLDSHPNTKVREKLLTSNNRSDNEKSDNMNSIINSNTSASLLEENENKNENIVFSPVSLEFHRMFLLQEQIQALKEAVSEYNDEIKTQKTSIACDPKSGVCYIKDDNDDESITIEQVQECLTSLGNDDFTNIDGCETEKELCNEISITMMKMNNAARLAFARSVLWSEVVWAKQYEKDHLRQSCTKVEDCESILPGTSSFIDYNEVKRKLHRRTESKMIDGDSSDLDDNDEQMTRSAILEYCGLVCTAVKLPAVRDYISKGTAIFPIEPGKDGCHNLVASNKYTPQQRILNIQNMMLCAVGYEPLLGGLQIRQRIMKIQQVHDEQDEELNTVLSKYMSTIQKLVAKNVVLDFVKRNVSDDKISQAPSH